MISFFINDNNGDCYEVNSPTNVHLCLYRPVDNFPSLEG